VIRHDEAWDELLRSPTWKISTDYWLGVLRPTERPPCRVLLANTATNWER